MQYTKLGNTGITVSRICLGCMSYGDGKWREWTVGADEARKHFAAALDAGVNFFDTADVYSAGASEEITGRWLGEMASRDDIVLATKVNGPMGPGPNRRGLSRKHILEACDNSLRRLKTDSSTSIKSIAGIFRRQLKKHSMLWTLSCVREKCVISVQAAWRPGNSRKPFMLPRSAAGTGS